MQRPQSEPLGQQFEAAAARINTTAATAESPFGQVRVRANGCIEALHITDAAMRTSPEQLAAALIALAETARIQALNELDAVFSALVDADAPRTDIAAQPHQAAANIDDEDSYYDNRKSWLV